MEALKNLLLAQKQANNDKKLTHIRRTESKIILFLNHARAILIQNYFSTFDERIMMMLSKKTFLFSALLFLGCNTQHTLASEMPSQEVRESIMKSAEAIELSCTQCILIMHAREEQQLLAKLQANRLQQAQLQQAITRISIARAQKLSENDNSFTALNKLTPILSLKPSKNSASQQNS